MTDAKAPTSGTAGAAGRAPATSEASVRGNRYWWDLDADSYHDQHGEFLGICDFVWCPERVREEEAALLGPVKALRGQRVLEVGSGSAQCSRWLAGHGVRTVAFDVSGGMLRHAQSAARTTGISVPLVQADAQRIPFRDRSFDHAFTAYGAVPFVGDSALVMREIARVLRPGGRWVFSTTHPMRWAFPDDPGPNGLIASGSYFDRTPYIETDDDGNVIYAEHHRTIGDRIRELTAAGFVIGDIVEPAWPPGLTTTWGQWSPLRGSHFPGTAIYCCVKG